MRPTLRRTAAIAVLALVTALGGCSDAAAPEDDASTAPTEQNQEPAPTAEPAPEPTPGPTTEAPAETTLRPEVMLTGAAFGADEIAPVVTEPVDAWALPESCGVGGPSTALASRSVTYGAGEAGSAVGVQQLAVFPDRDTAYAEMNRIHIEVGICVNIERDGQTIYEIEGIGVGGQGMGLAAEDLGSSTTGNLDEARGSYVVMTRRGNAVTLVGHLGGEASIGTSRENAVASSQAAWELLCVYDSAGC